MFTPIKPSHSETSARPSKQTKVFKSSFLKVFGEHFGDQLRTLLRKVELAAAVEVPGIFQSPARLGFSPCIPDQQSYQLVQY